MSDPEFFDELEGLIGKHREKAAAAEQDKATEERFKRIEDGLEGIGKKLDEHFSSPAAADPSESSAADKGGDKDRPADRPESPPEPEPELNVERVSKMTVPRIYAGDDEPEIVQYIDAEDGEIKTRKGRRKNYPTQTNVEIVMPEPENRPQEPEAETA